MSSQTLVEPCPDVIVETVRRPILIVEDDAMIAEVLMMGLRQQGFDPLHASSGAQALQLARQLRPQLVLLDLQLPDVDGFHVCQELDEDPATCGTPVIVLSGMEQADIVRRARAAGCRYYVRKPYDPNALLLLIQQSVCESDTLESLI